MSSPGFSGFVSPPDVSTTADGMPEVTAQPPAAREGMYAEFPVSDEAVHNVLYDILKELKIMNIHLAVLSDTWISRQEVE